MRGEVRTRRRLALSVSTLFGLGFDKYDYGLGMQAAYELSAECVPSCSGTKKCGDRDADM